jgi:ATP-dependent Clp protease, protease subunit
LATEMTSAFQATAKFDLDDLPEHVKAVFMSAKPPEATPPAKTDEHEVISPEQVVALADAAGFKSHAPRWSLQHTSEKAVKAVIAHAKLTKAYCEAVSQPKLADKFIFENKSLADVRAALLAAQVAADEAAHVSSIRPSNSGVNPQASQVDTNKIYKKRAEAQRKIA